MFQMSVSGTSMVKFIYFKLTELLLPIAIAKRTGKLVEDFCPEAVGEGGGSHVVR